MSFNDRPHAWCTPMGLFAVIGPSRKDQRGPCAFCWRSFSKMRFSSQKRSISRSMAGKSGTLATGLYMLVNNIRALSPVRGRRNIASYVSTSKFSRNREWLKQDWLGRVVFDLNAQRLRNFQVLIAYFRFGVRQGFVDRLAQFLHQLL